MAATLVLSGATAIALAASVVGGPAANATTPGTPGAPQAGTQLYFEDFSNQNASSAAIQLPSYTGSAAVAQSETYTASPKWLPAGNECDGWILNSTTPLTASTTSADSGCANQASVWPSLQFLADDMGLYQGQSAAAAATNQVVSAYTNEPNIDPGAGTQLQTTKSIPAVAGHYYTVKAVYGAVNCHSTNPIANDPSATLNLLVNGTAQTVGSGLDPCTAAGAQTYAATIAGRSRTAAVASLIGTSAFRVPTTGSPVLGIQLFNAQTSRVGNDSAFDSPQIVDVTPQLDKAFNPTTITAGGTSTLTYTVTAADVTNGKITNTATATGLPPTGSKVTSPPSTVVVIVKPKS
jgi:hypothetical protein